MRGQFRLYDYDALVFRGPLESRADAEKRKSRTTKGKRDVLSNWFRARVHPVKVEPDGSISDGYAASVALWRIQTKARTEE